MVFCYLLPGCNRPSIGQTVQDKGDKAQKSNERLFKFYPNLTEVGRRADYPGSVQALPVLPGRRSRSEGEELGPIRIPLGFGMRTLTSCLQFVR